MEKSYNALFADSGWGWVITEDFVFQDNVGWSNRTRINSITQTMRNEGFKEEFIKVYRHILSIDDFIDPSHLYQVVKIAKDKNLDVVILLQINKGLWMDFAFAFPKAVKYAIQNPMLGHWIIWFETKNIIVQFELLKQLKKDCKEFFMTIKARNGREMKDQEEVIIPRVLANVVKPSIKFAPCDILWEQIVTTVMLDHQAFKTYDKYLNNCQQWVERICKRNNIECCVSAIPDTTADTLREFC